MDISELRIFTEPQQGNTYDELLGSARRAEQLGFGAWFRSDHYLKMGNVTGLPGPSDAWITLAGLARDTSTIRLGTMVTSATFRHPGVLAIGVANVDQMSGGRVELGLGAGWYKEEHEAYGIPFRELGERFDDLEEEYAIIHGLWNTPLGETFSKPGGRWPITDSPALPKPVQPGGIPLIVGGGGPKRTPALAARYAAEFNASFGDVERFQNQLANGTKACAAIGRDPGTLLYSVCLTTAVGTDDAEIARRAAAIGREVDELRENGMCGTPEQCAETLHKWIELGAQRFYLQTHEATDLEHLDLIAEVAKLL